MIINLPKELESSVRAAVISGQFMSEDAMVAVAVTEYLERQLMPREHPTGDQVPSRQPPKTLLETIEEMTATVPESEWKRLPVDGSAQLDHYIYGTPKRPTG